MKQKYFWNKKWFWISLTSLATVGLATFSTISNSTKTLKASNLTKSMFEDSTAAAPDVNTLSGYGYHAARVINYIPWTDDSAKKIVDVFPTVAIANQVLSGLRAVDTAKFSNAATINAEVLKTDLAKVKILNFSNLNLTNIDEVLNPAITWTNLISISLSNNDFSDYVLKFEQIRMPKLYSITARSAKLKEMVDVSSYVKDPFDQAESGASERTAAEAQYTKALTSGVPRYFDLFQNNIPQIPKYYLKIALAYLDLGANQLGAGTSADPQGVYGIPWYSMKTTNANTIGIADPEIRGPYGINLYNTGDKDSSGSYTYSDEKVARWRAQPYPIKGLRFAKYNATPTTAGILDSGVSFPGSDDNPATGSSASDPYFNFAYNNLVNVPIFKQSNVTYDRTSAIAPQSKAATVFVGLDDFQKSKRYTEPTKKPEMVTPQPDIIYPIMSNWSWNGMPQNNLTWFEQGLQGVYYPRSFNGINQFAITSDSRTTNNQWDNNVSGLMKDASGGVAWSVPTLPTSNWNSLLSSNPAFFGSSAGNLNFTASSNTNYYQKWAALRTFPLSAKTFAKKGYLDSWNGQNEVDSNLYYDNEAWTGASTSDTLTPNGKIGKTWFYQNLVGHNPAPRLSVTGSSPTRVDNQFSGASDPTFGLTINSYILGLSEASYFSNISGPSDYGTPQATKPPYTQGLTIKAPSYTYQANYQVVDTIKSNFATTTNFPTSLDVTGFDLSQYKKDNQPVFARNVTADDIKNGSGVFWKSDSQFDQAYMKTLDPTKIKMEWDDAAGTLKYSFPVYSPGYSTLGRLFQKDDSGATATNNATPTIDFEVSNTITGFAKTSLKIKDPTGNNFSDVDPNSASNHVLTQKAPEDFLTWVKSNAITNTTDSSTLSSLQTQIGKDFETNYLGNNPSAQEGVATPLSSSNVQIVNIDNSNGSISFQVKIPDHVFGNGNRLIFPQAYKDLTFTWTGLPVPNMTIAGTNLSQTNAPGLSFSDFNLGSYTQFTNKAASQITAKEIVDANVIVTTRGDWAAIKDDTNNLSKYLELNPSDVNGTLTWTLKLPGDTNTRNQGLLPLTVVVQWAGFANQNTSIVWKDAATLTPLGLGKTPNELLADIQANPAKYLTVTNGRENGGTSPLVASDFDFSKITSESVINAQQGTVQVRGISLKSYYKNGVWINNSSAPVTGVTPVYLPVPTVNLQGQIPYSVATFLSTTPGSGETTPKGNQAIWDSVKPFYTKSLYDDTSETNDALVKKLSTSEIKQLLVKNGLSPLDNVLTLTTNPATGNPVARSNLKYKNNDLKQSITANPLTGTLTFENLQVNNWITKGSNTPVNDHALDVQTYTFTKLTNSWKWANVIPLAVSSLSFNTILTELNDSTNANVLMDHFNVGQKYYDNDGVLKNAYTVNPSLIELDPYLGTLTFKSGAVQVSNWVTDGNVSTTLHTVSQEKVYTLTNKLQTQYKANTNLTQGLNQYISDWVQIVKNDSYTNASEQKKAQYLAELNQLQAPNYTNVDVEQGIALTNKYIAEKGLKQISTSDKAIIDGLKNKSGFNSIDFSNYFYVPQYLLFLSSPTPNAAGSNRTFAVAESVGTTQFSNTSMELKNVYIINYYNSPGSEMLSIQKISDILFTGFSRAVSRVTFNSDDTHVGTNKLAAAWENLRPSQIKERLDYLTLNRNNPTITGSAYWQAIQQEWLSTFTYKNIPYNGNQDPTIVYPLSVVASDYQRRIVIKQLLFPYYSQTTTNDAGVIALNQKINSDEVWVAKVGFDSFIQQVANLSDERFQKIPSTLLKNLDLKEGMQSDGGATWNKLLAQNIYVLNGNLPPISNSATNTGKTPAVTVKKISVDDKKGTITFEDIMGTNVWVNGEQVESKSFGSLVLNLGLQSTELVKNSNNVISQWLGITTNEKTISASLISFNEKILSGEFGVTEFDAMLNNPNAFFNVSNPADDPETRVQVIPGTQLSEVFHLNMTNGEVTLKNLQIIKGYLNNVKVASQNVSAPLVFHLGWDYSTNFNQQFQVLLTQKNLLHSNTDHAATVLNQDPQQLLRYLNVQELEGQIETPSVSVSSNAVLGKLTFNVHFKNYYQNGVNLGAWAFSYTFNEFQQTLPAILGGIGAGLAVILIALIAWYIRNYIKNKDQLMIKTTKKAKHKE